MSSPAYTVAEYARRFGVSTQAARGWFPSPAPAVRTVNGKSLAAWPLAALPEARRQAGEAIARRQRFATLEAWFAAMLETWHPDPPFAQWPAEDQLYARTLCRALSDALEIFARNPDAKEEWLAAGVRGFCREFKKDVSSKWIEKLVDRITSRDRGAENWQRVQLYLPKVPSRREQAPAALVTPSEEEFRPLKEWMQTSLRDGQPQSSHDRGMLWLTALELFEAMLAAGRDEKPLRIALVKFLARHAPALAGASGDKENALRVAFRRNLDGWRAAGRTWDYFLDGRETKRGVPTKPPIPQEDIARLRWQAGTRTNKMVAQAVRELNEAGQLSPLTPVPANPGSKSYVNRRLMREIKPHLDSIAACHTGDADSLYPSRDVSYAGRFSMKRLQADDFTFGVRVIVPDGQGWYRHTRAQFILVADDRSGCILSCAGHEEEQPNSLLARTAFVSAFAKHGIPGELHIERGKVFADSKLVTGGPIARRIAHEADAPHSLAQVEFGLRQYGCKIIVAQGPEAKGLIEHIGCRLQDFMHGEPGFCGRQVREEDCPEETRHWLRELARRNPAALEHFYTLPQWVERVWQLCDRYNNEVQDKGTKRIPGMSPLQAFRAFWPWHDPPGFINAKLRILLATHRLANLEIKPREGITFTLRGQRYRYHGEETGKRPHKIVTAYFDPELPEICTFADKALTDVFTVARAPQSQEDAESQNAAAAAAAAHARPMVSMYRTLAAQPWAKFRGIVSNPATVELCEHMEAQKEKATTEKREQSNRRRVIQTEGRKANLPAALLEDDSQRTRDAVTKIREAMEEAEHENDTPRRPAPKTYVLENHAGASTRQRDYLGYLVRQLTKFRKAGCFGQKFSSPITEAVTQRIVCQQLGANLEQLAATRFAEAVAYLHEKIDSTILGKRNHAKGAPNYHPFAEHEQPA